MIGRNVSSWIVREPDPDAASVISFNGARAFGSGMTFTPRSPKSGAALSSGGRWSGFA